MKKRYLLLVLSLVAAVSFAGCKDKEEPQANAPAPTIQVVTDTPTITTEDAPVEEESREGMYRSELTNEWIDEALKDQRPIAAMVDNEKTALPHYGLSKADIVYEMTNSTLNDGVTRFMVLFKDYNSVDQIGSIRSVRPTNLVIAPEWDAIVCHDGGPFYIDDYLANDYVDHFSGTFSRVDNGKSREFTEYVCTGDLDKKFSASKYTTEYNEFYPGQHYQFSNTEVDLSASGDAIDCTAIELPFPHNGSNLKYNESTGTYDYYEYGQAHTDPQHGNAQLTFKNLLIQDTTFSQLDDNGYLIYNAIDSGRDAYYITNGKAIEVTWIKAGENDPTIYLDKKTGEQIELNTGKTYVALVPSDSWNDVVIK